MTTPSLATPRRGFVVAAATIGLFLFSSAAPTPLYRLYAAQWHFSAVSLTAVFAVYALALLLALLLCGPLSDAVGRRPVILSALLTQAVAMLLFLEATSLPWLYAARTLQGIATGLVTAAVAAALIDLQPPERPARGAVVNAVTPTFGLTGGALVSGALVQYAPHPLRLVYVLLLVGFLLLALALLLVPETVSPRSRPRLSVRLGIEPEVRPAFLAVLPALVATWALGGLYLSLGPSIEVLLTGSTNKLLGGAVVALLPFVGGLTSLVGAAHPPQLVMLAGCAALVLGGLTTVGSLLASSFWLFLLGTAIAGAGFGAGFLGAFRTLAALASPARRGALVAAVYVAAYLAFSLPAILAGLLATSLGLRATVIGYALAIALLAALAAGATAHRSQEAKATP